MTTRKLRRVVIESPLAGDVELNVRYARACLRDSLRLGECPFASHAIYALPGVLDDLVPHERELGIAAGLEWARKAHATVAYVDLGISSGMRRGIEHARQVGRTIEQRCLPFEDYQRVLQPLHAVDLARGNAADVVRNLRHAVDVVCNLLPSSRKPIILDWHLGEALRRLQDARHLMVESMNSLDPATDPDNACPECGDTGRDGGSSAPCPACLKRSAQKLSQGADQ